MVRGARQVGKSYLVKLFAGECFEHLIEIDFERDPDLASLFASRRPSDIVPLLETQFDARIEPGSCLLFLDEIQAAPDVFICLRYFREELPGLHVIAAGSLLDNALAQKAFSVPVGRIEYLHLGPMQFEEYLIAAGHQGLVDFVTRYRPGDRIPEALHQKLLAQLRRFLHTGGMPEAVEAILDSGSLRDGDIVKQSILSTFQDDFGKYGRRVDPLRLAKVFRKLPQLVGRRFKYVQVDRHERSKDLAAALDLLCLARVAYRVCHSSASGLPLAAQANERLFKVLFLDVGLMARALGLDLREIERADDVMLVNAGAMAEQLVGQHLLYSAQPYEEPELHFWAREKKSALAEVDYVIADRTRIVPVEVKAGKTGRLKSLHVFLADKGLAHGVRLDSRPPSVLRTSMTLPDGRETPFELLSLPLYMVGQLRRLYREWTEKGNP
ncbi:MAG: AAA family ATPase [Deltaproteobacteria bacterium]|nr:AAA family ATPase [Deltaproteobacteria bacterium]